MNNFPSSSQSLKSALRPPRNSFPAFLYPRGSECGVSADIRWMNWCETTGCIVPLTSPSLGGPLHFRLRGWCFVNRFSGKNVFSFLRGLHRKKCIACVARFFHSVFFEKNWQTFKNIRGNVETQRKCSYTIFSGFTNVFAKSGYTCLHFSKIK